MTNTLTWDFKPIALPKVNANLLSVISLILLLTMTFLTGSTIASHCGQIVLELSFASAAVGAATVALELSKAALAGAAWSLNPGVIATLAAAVALSASALAIAVAAVAYLTAKLYECEKEHSASGASADASGGCDSGSCGGSDGSTG